MSAALPGKKQTTPSHKSILETSSLQCHRFRSVPVVFLEGSQSSYRRSARGLKRKVQSTENRPATPSPSQAWAKTKASRCFERPHRLAGSAAETQSTARRSAPPCSRSSCASAGGPSWPHVGKCRHGPDMSVQDFKALGDACRTGKIVKECGNKREKHVHNSSCISKCQVAPAVNQPPSCQALVPTAPATIQHFYKRRSVEVSDLTSSHPPAHRAVLVHPAEHATQVTHTHTHIARRKKRDRK